MTAEIKSALGMQFDPEKREFSDTLAGILNHLSILDWQLPSSAVINPLWCVREIAGIGEGLFDDRIYAVENPLSAFSTLTAICHGDLHGDNILCSSLETGVPRPVLVDFETTHDGHICRDFARLEAAILCQSFSWSTVELTEVAKWFDESLTGDVYHPPKSANSSDAIQRAVTGVGKLRSISAGCGQQLWPLTNEEYKLALLAALLPIVRYDGLQISNRVLALVLSSCVASSLTTDFS